MIQRRRLCWPAVQLAFSLAYSPWQVNSSFHYKIFTLYIPRKITLLLHELWEAKLLSLIRLKYISLLSILIVWYEWSILRFVKSFQQKNLPIKRKYTAELTRLLDLMHQIIREVVCFLISFLQTRTCWLMINTRANLCIANI